MSINTVTFCQQSMRSHHWKILAKVLSYKYVHRKDISWIPAEFNPTPFYFLLKKFNLCVQDYCYLVMYLYSPCEVKKTVNNAFFFLNVEIIWTNFLGSGIIIVLVSSLPCWMAKWLEQFSAVAWWDYFHQVCASIMALIIFCCNCLQDQMLLCTTRLYPFCLEESCKKQTKAHKHLDSFLPYPLKSLLSKSEGQVTAAAQFIKLFSFHMTRILISSLKMEGGSVQSMFLIPL